MTSVRKVCGVTVTSGNSRTSAVTASSVDMATHASLRVALDLQFAAPCRSAKRVQDPVAADPRAEDVV